MAVRDTELRIPGGFDKAHADKLGFAVENGDYILVSYLPKEVHQSTGEVEHPVRNTYIVFVKPTANAPTSYDCQFKFSINDEEDQIEIPLINHEYGEFELNTAQIQELHEKNLSNIEVMITLKGIPSEVELKLTHSVATLDSEIEDLFKNTGSKSAVGGSPEITRMLGNDYREYLLDYVKDFEETKKKAVKDEIEDYEVLIPPNVVATVIYLYQLNNSLESQKENLDLWKDYLNKGKNADELTKVPLGIAHIRPYMFSLFLDTYDGTEKCTNSKALTTEHVWKGIMDHDYFEERIFNVFKSIDNDKKTDLFNLLRFPKSSISACAAYLKGLQRFSLSEWKDLGFDELIENKEAIKTIISEYKRGPSKDLEDFTEIGEKVYSTMFAKYIETILKKDYIGYHIVNIKVLDIRSGKPLENKKIKRLLIFGINGSDKKFFGEKGKAVFSNTHEKITESDPIKAAKMALARLGYSPGTLNNTWNASVEGQYNIYWADRLLDISQSGVTQPDDYYLNRIVDEYNSHAFTNDQGIVEVKIPKKFLDNREVHILIGFWEFPTALEELDSDDRSDPITRNVDSDEVPAESSTEFKVSWVGTQTTNWGDYVGADDSYESSKHFGWVVKHEDEDYEAQLKAWQKIIVKDDTDPFEEYDEDLMSKYYEVTGDHFVLFGMEWCQPVWDVFEDPIIDKIAAININIYRQIQGLKSLHMHLATMYRDLGGTEIYGGKGYGKRDFQSSGSSYAPKYRGNNGHQGIDVHAKKGDPVFAVHGGITTRHTASIAGNYITLNWDTASGALSFTQYLHLDSYVSTENEKVLSGAIVGKAGRSGNLGEVSEWPGHLHLWVTDKNTDGEVVELRNSPDDDNKVCIPFNDTPLLFPCRADITQESDSPEDCEFSELKYLKKCWAAAELRCPYIHDKDQNEPIIIQAQLRYLNEKPSSPTNPFKKDNNPDYLHPGEINGILGDLSTGGDVNLNEITNAKKLEFVGFVQSPDIIYLSFGDLKGKITVSDLQPYTAHSGYYTFTVEQMQAHGGKIVLLPYFGDLEDGTLTVSESRKAINKFKEKKGVLETPSPNEKIINFLLNDSDLIELNKEENAKIAEIS